MEHTASEAVGHVMTKTTAEWFAEALERCGVGNYILLSDAIKIMHRIGWETKEPFAKFPRQRELEAGQADRG